MNREDLEQLNKAELIDILLNQAEQITKLMATVQQLQAEYEALKMKFDQNRKPPTSSQNSSQPPSRDQKASLPKDRKKRRHGPPLGHERHERQLVAQADHTIELHTKECRQCHLDMAAEPGRLVRVNQITELPEGPAQVIEVRQYEVTCPHCGKAQVEEPPAGLEMDRAFGSRLEATVVYYRQEQHMSYARTERALLDLHQVEISQGGIDEIMKRGGRAAIQREAELQQAIRQSQVIHCDETTSRVDGATWWEWVFCTANAVLHVTRSNRSTDVIRDVMGEAKADVWVSDCYGAQLKAPARERQFCLAHQLRNLQAVVDMHPHLLWPKALQALFRHAIHLHHQRDQLPPKEFCDQVARIERITDRLLSQALNASKVQKLQHRYLKYRQCLFVFLYRTDVDPTNNVAERALRPSVIHRKVTGGFRSEWGTKAYAALALVVDTAELTGVRAFDAVQSLFGPPSLPIPLAGE